MKRTLIGRGAAALALVLLASACSGEDADPTVSAGPTTTTVPPTTVVTTTTSSAPIIGDVDLGSKPVVSVHTEPAPAELVINDIVLGDGAEAQAGSLVVAQYVGVRYTDGVQFDASWDRGQPFEFVLGYDSVIQGWHLGFEGMREGGRRELVIPPDLAYGPAGAGELIGPDETLIFVVDLVEVRSPFPAPQLDTADRVVLPNQGGVFEGATLTESTASAPTLIVGDESAPNLPPGEGLEIYITFDLSQVQSLDGAGLVSAQLRSHAMQIVEGTPFEDLGPLNAVRVQYESFPPTPDERLALGDEVACEADPAAVQLSCNVLDTVEQALADGVERISFRLRFATPTDADGEPDFALFFVTTQGLNEPGVFTLELGLSPS